MVRRSQVTAQRWPWPTPVTRHARATGHPKGLKRMLDTHYGRTRRTSPARQQAKLVQNVASPGTWPEDGTVSANEQPPACHFQTPRVIDCVFATSTLAGLIWRNPSALRLDARIRRRKRLIPSLVGGPVMSRLEDFVGLPRVTNPNHWQMAAGERAFFCALLAALRPKVYWEVGVYFGGSLECAANFSKSCVGFDIEDPSSRFSMPQNARLVVGNSEETLPEMVKQVNLGNEPAPDLVLVDGNHDAPGVFADVLALMALDTPSSTLLIMHDASNPSCRSGIEQAFREGQARSPRFLAGDLDWMVGRITEFGGGLGEVWGGFAVALLGEPDGAPAVVANSKATTMALHAISDVSRTVFQAQ